MYNSRKSGCRRWKILVEGGVLSGRFESGCYVKPAIAEADNTFEIVQHETLLYLLNIRNCRKCHCHSKRVAQGYHRL
jgi:hypothetical protein